MLLQIGPRKRELQLVDLLTECHARIRHFLDLAYRITATPGLTLDDIHTAAWQIHRYFTTAFPLHLADEDETVIPRLRGRNSALDAALAQVEADHEEHADGIEHLVVLCDRVIADPRQLAARAREFAETVDQLTLALEAHLALEELVVFPALDALSTVERAVIRAELRSRRAA